MEKRLFLAVLLSLGVVFGFQTMFTPKKELTTQTIDNKDDITKEIKILPSEKVAAPIPVQAISFEEKILTVKNSIYEVTFSNKGGNIDSIYLKKYELLLPVNMLASLDVFADKRFDGIQGENGEIKFIFKDKDWEVTKRFVLENNYTINQQIKIKNIAPTKNIFSGNITNICVDISRLDKINVQSDWSLNEYSIKNKKGFIRKDNVRNLNDKWNKEEITEVDFVAFRDKYFVTIIKSAEEQKNYLIKALSETKLIMGAVSSGIMIEPGKEIEFNYKIYSGPQDLDLLKKAGKEFDTVMVFSNWGWLDAISKGIYWMLGFLYKIIPVWGMCIILISLIVYGVMYPLTVKSLTSMKKLQILQPKMKELQEKYKNNPEKLNKEIVDLYRIHQVNPLSGCLPMILQMPIFVGLYQVLWRSIYFRGEGFLWMKDLALPDRTLKLPFTIPFMGEYLNILPILMVAIMAVQQQMNIKTMTAANEEQAQQQKMMAIFFPILIGFIFYNMASGLNLYFVVFYVLSTLSQWHISQSSKAVV